MKRVDKIVSSLPKEQQAENRKMAEGLGDIFDGLNIGDFGKKMIKSAIDWAQETLLPKIQARNTAAAIVIAGLLDALEGALK